MTKIFFFASLISCFLLGPFPGFALEDFQTSQSHSFVAHVAGVNQTIMVSPANSRGEINSTVLAAAHITGINKVFRIGGGSSHWCTC